MASSRRGALRLEAKRQVSDHNVARCAQRLNRAQAVGEMPGKEVQTMDTKTEQKSSPIPILRRRASGWNWKPMSITCHSTIRTLP